MSETFQVGNLTVRLEQDSDGCNPRTEWDNAATMVCWHRNYLLGDSQYTHKRSMKLGTPFFPTPQDFQESSLRREAVVILPLYLYDHSGITISCAPFSCPWDSEQVGWIFMTRKQILDNWGGKRITKALKEKAIKLMQSEIEVYDQYLTGDVWYVAVEDEDGNVLDSCGGFFGSEYAEEEGKRMAEACLASAKKCDEMEANSYAL